jgi:hypothetical protein
MISGRDVFFTIKRLSPRIYSFMTPQSVI